MKKTRNSLGRFEKTAPIEEDNETIAKIPENWSKKIILILLAIVFLSPWLVMLTRKNTIGGIQAKVSDLYDEVFACPNCPQNNCTCPPEQNCKLSEKLIEYGKEKIGL
jgi:hypothetical protein